MTSNNSNKKPFVLDTLIELLYGIRIFLSPALIGLILGLLVYFYFKNALGLVLGIVLFISGIVLGLIWANRIYKSKNGTAWYLSRTMATPELDKDEV